MEKQPSLNAFISAASTCAHEMLANASYIQEQLPTIDMSDEHRAAIIEVCSALVSTKHDVISELFELEDLAVSAEASTIKARVERIIRWLAEVAKTRCAGNDASIGQWGG